MAHCIVLRVVKSASCVGMGLLLIVLLQAGCKRSTTVVGPKGEKVTVTKDGDTAEVAFKGINGEEIRSAGGKKGVALPANLPAAFPIYPKATPVTVATVGKETTSILTTADPRQKVVAFYKDKMKENGWKSKSSTEMPQISMFEGEKSGRTMTALISEAPDGTVQIALSNKE